MHRIGAPRNKPAGCGPECIYGYCRSRYPHGGIQRKKKLCCQVCRAFIRWFDPVRRDLAIETCDKCAAKRRRFAR